MIAYHERFRTPRHAQAGSGRTRPPSAHQEEMQNATQATVQATRQEEVQETIQAGEAALSIANTTHVVTVCIRGRHCHPAPVTSQRIALLDRIVTALIDTAPDWPSVDAVVFPGGYFRIRHAIGTKPHRAWARLMQRESAGEALRRASLSLSMAWPRTALVSGIDSNPVSAGLGGDELTFAWQDGDIVAFARKAFPVAVETSGWEVRETGPAGRTEWVRRPVLWVNPDDADQPGRVLVLRNARRAILLCCYDAFGLRVLYGRNQINGVAIRLIRDKRGKYCVPTRAERDHHLRRWLAMLDAHPPDLGLVPLHLFLRPGQMGTGSVTALPERVLPFVEARSLVRRILPTGCPRPYAVLRWLHPAFQPPTSSMVRADRPTSIIPSTGSHCLARMVSPPH
jgi:hypothetical protein